MGRSVFYYLGWYAVICLLFESDRKAHASGMDIAFALLVAVLNFLPAASVTWVSATAFAAFLIATSRGDRKLQAAAAVLFALAFNGMWGPVIFEVLAIYLLRADAALVGTVLSLTQPGMTWNDTVVGVPGGHSVFIYSPCSSFHNISLGLLCWVAVTKLIRTTWLRTDVLVAVAVTAAVILLNASRLYLMALSPEHFTYWHDGFGDTVYAWATTFVVLLISLWGAVRLGRMA
jgi:exosortase/archaeosortase family protein